MARTLNNKALAAVLGVDAGLLSRWARRAGFPADVVNGVRVADEREVREWIGINVPGHGKRERRADAEKPAAATSPAVVHGLAALAKPDDPFIRTLQSGEAKPRDMLLAAQQLAARQVATQACAGLIPAQQLDAINRACRELREADLMELDLMERSGRLVDREAAQAVAGQMAMRLNTILDTLVNTLALQIEHWLVEPAFAANPEERRRVVRAWMEERASELRRLEADEIDALLEAQIAEESAPTPPPPLNGM